ncbi:MAG: hypothetical protein LUD25_02985 [Coriobacteriaceae bacterium]|nr:hypothetical protein [Coriobacteriaceae bacterium]
MVFSSSTFLLAFLPVTLILYFIIPCRPYRNVLLLVASLFFYAWGEPSYVVLMLFSILFNWLLGCAIQGSKNHARIPLVISLILNLLVLGFFKYEGFVADSINTLLGTSIPNLELPLPIGISFYTLQALSYVIDVYRGKVAAQKNPLYLGMYIAMFPQLIAGPIVRYSTIEEQVQNRKENFRDFCSGARLFVIGMGKKVLLANIVAILAEEMLARGGADIGVIGAWSGLVAYAFQIFFDFAGYSDMAIGLGKMFGFQYLRNFNYPYISKNITEFWRRWHISLSSFFRDYLYIPLGGSRVAKPRWVFNLFVVWFLTGLWHGAAWNFVLWGLFYLAILLLEKLVWGNLLARLPSIVQHLYSILVFMFAWLLFWIEDMGQMGQYLTAMFGGFGLTGGATLWELTFWEYLPVLVICIVAATPILPWLRAKLVAWVNGRKLKNFLECDIPNEKALATKSLCDYQGYLEEGRAAGTLHSKRSAVFSVILTLADIALIALFVLSICAIVSGSFNPFIYFRF